MPGRPEVARRRENSNQFRPRAEIEAEESAVQGLRARVMELVRRDCSEKAWQMFWMTTVDGLAASEVAARFGVTSAAVRVAKARVLNKLRALMPGSD